MRVNGIEVKVGDVWCAAWNDDPGSPYLVKVRSLAFDGTRVFVTDLMEGAARLLEDASLLRLLRRSGETEDRTRWQYSDEPGYNPADGAGLYGTGNPDVIRAPRQPAEPRRMIEQAGDLVELPTGINSPRVALWRVLYVGAQCVFCRNIETLDERAIEKAEMEDGRVVESGEEPKEVDEESRR